MKYTIKVFTHQIQATISDDFPKVIQYFQTHGIELVLDIEETTVEKAQALLQLMIPNDGKCDVVAYMYDRSVNDMPSFGLAFDVSPTLRGIYLATSIVDDNVDYTWKSLCHEIMHTFFHKLHSLGLTLIYDPMDNTFVNGKWIPYYNNEQPYSPDSNFGYAWKNLEPFMDKLFPKADIVLTRKYANDKEQLGDMCSSDGKFNCRTLELPWKLNQPFISCIPRGIYKVEWTRSFKFPLGSYEIKNVPNRSGVRIHAGNFFFNVDGCILLGETYGDINHDAWADILNSRATVKKMEDFLQRKPFTLEIR